MIPKHILPQLSIIKPAPLFALAHNDPQMPLPAGDCVWMAICKGKDQSLAGAKLFVGEFTPDPGGWPSAHLYGWLDAWLTCWL